LVGRRGAYGRGVSIDPDQAHVGAARLGEQRRLVARPARQVERDACVGQRRHCEAMAQDGDERRVEIGECVSFHGDNMPSNRL